METLTKESIKTLIQPRIADSHKGNYGHALIVAGV
jgi:NAD(P)H-hydrate repair Nnr-like enzyme with NAD(P)H-hydrate dehydratase domain